MRPWLKLWPSRLADGRLFPRGSDSAIAYLRICLASVEGVIPRGSADGLAGPENVTALLASGALTVSEAGDVLVRDWCPDQRTKVPWAAKSDAARHAALVRWEREKGTYVKKDAKRSANRNAKVEGKKEEEISERGRARARAAKAAETRRQRFEALAWFAAASGGRYAAPEPREVAGKLVYALDSLRRDFPEKKDWEAAGAFLAGGGEAFRGVVGTWDIARNFRDWHGKGRCKEAGRADDGAQYRTGALERMREWDKQLASNGHANGFRRIDPTAVLRHAGQNGSTGSAGGNGSTS